MTRYPAWIDGEQGSYGISFPDLPGIVAMGTTVDEALMHAEEALRDYVIEAERAGEAITPPSAIERVETPAGHTLVSIPLIRLSGRSVRANLTLDEGVVEPPGHRLPHRRRGRRCLEMEAEIYPRGSRVRRPHVSSSPGAEERTTVQPGPGGRPRRA